MAVVPRCQLQIIAMGIPGSGKTMCGRAAMHLLGGQYVELDMNRQRPQHYLQIVTTLSKDPAIPVLFMGNGHTMENYRTVLRNALSPMQRVVYAIFHSTVAKSVERIQARASHRRVMYRGLDLRGIVGRIHKSAEFLTREEVQHAVAVIHLFPNTCTKEELVEALLDGLAPLSIPPPVTFTRHQVRDAVTVTELTVETRSKCSRDRAATVGSRTLYWAAELRGEQVTAVFAHAMVAHVLKDYPDLIRRDALHCTLFHGSTKRERFHEETQYSGGTHCTLEVAAIVCNQRTCSLELVSPRRNKHITLALADGIPPHYGEGLHPSLACHARRTPLRNLVFVNVPMKRYAL